MIPLSRVVSQIEKYVTLAKTTGDDRNIRESLLAIRALCEVALSEQPDVTSPGKPIQIIQTNQPNTTVQATSAGEPLIEEDANGNSLFDF